MSTERSERRCEFPLVKEHNWFEIPTSKKSLHSFGPPFKKIMKRKDFDQAIGILKCFEKKDVRRTP